MRHVSNLVFGHRARCARNRTAMATSLRPLPSALLCVSPRHAVVGCARGNIISSIRFKSTRVPLAARNSLPWSEYLAIRRGKRKWEIVCLVVLFWIPHPRLRGSYSIAGGNRAMCAGRISRRRRVLWLHGIGRNQAYNGGHKPSIVYGIPCN